MILSAKQRDVLVYLDGCGRASARRIRVETGARQPTLGALQRLGLVYRSTTGQWHITPNGRDAIR